MKENTIILPTTYFGNIEYFSALSKFNNILIEAHEHYEKQTSRNRCYIVTANGPLILTVPVNHSNTLKTKTKDVTIDYSKNWQKQHFRAIESGYRRSPYYEYYIDDLMFVFEKKEKYLLDLNQKILHELCELVKLKINIETTNVYNEISKNQDDLLTNYHNTKNSKTKPYLQTFSSKHDFFPNMSIIDLLFNMGSDYKQFL